MVARHAVVRRMQGYERAIGVAGLLATAVSVALALDLLTGKAVGYDLAAYIMGARQLLGGEPIYPEGAFTLGPFGQFLYPPPVALLFTPIALLPFNAARVLWLLVLVAVAVGVAWSLTRRLRPHLRPWAWAGIALFFPLVWEIQLGNLTLVTLALCITAWQTRAPTWAGACALAMAAGLKLLALPLLPFFALSGRGALLVRSVGILAAASLATLPLLVEEWAAYIQTFAVIVSAEPGTGSNITPAVFALPQLRPVLPLAGVGLVTLSALVARRRPAAADHAFRVALAATPLAASTLWYPYLVLALPLLVAEAPTPSGPRWRLAHAAIRPTAWLVMQAQIVRDPGRDFILPFAGLLLLLATGVLELVLALRGAREGDNGPVVRAAT